MKGRTKSLKTIVIKMLIKPVKALTTKEMKRISLKTLIPKMR